jgi:hypothetical protein
MRAFWAILGFLILAAAAVVLMRSRETAGGSAPGDSASLAASAGAPPQPAPEPDAAPAGSDKPQAGASPDEAAEYLSAAGGAATEDAVPAEPLSEEEAARRLAEELFGSLAARDEAAPPDTGETGAANEAPPGGDGDAKTIDGKHIVRGSGTEDDPYRVTWDLLVSAHQTYRPKDGMTEIPERIRMLDGRYVEIAGYYAFPMMVEESSELLVMLNQWDGCCIGVPPTPYDGIEVKLRGPMRSTQNQVNYGTVIGRMKVDPYLVNDWLVGLYMMEDATLDLGL